MGVIRVLPALDDVAAYDVIGGSYNSGQARRFESLEEESFKKGMENNAKEFDLFDFTLDKRLDFQEFSRLMREREVGDFTEEELYARFNALDTDKSGTVRQPQCPRSERVGRN